MPIENLDETARQILRAASERFLHYGYGKTTMSEIAKDCNMSTGNLYRYFPSKLDIAESFARQLRKDHIERLKRAVSQPDLSPEDKLRNLLKASFTLAYDRYHNRPKAFELSMEILRERPEFALEWEEEEGAIITGVLAEGSAAGVFPAGNEARLARIVQDAVFRFTNPGIFAEVDYDMLSKELDEVIDLILDAFSWRASTARADVN